jgi:hypothetical protein
MCYSAVGRDARVSNQIRWLEAAGYTVDILSRDPEHPDATGRRLKIGEPSRRWQFVLFALMPFRLRFRGVVERYLPLAELDGETYDLVLVNDHHLLPWVVKAAPALARGPVVLDLHEVYSGNGTTLTYRLVEARYDDWLLTFIGSPVFTRLMTVAEGIADLYRDRYGVPRPAVIRNVAPSERLAPSPVDPHRILLEHHGYATVERGVDLMLDAALELDARFTLVLMVLGGEDELALIREHPAVRTGRAVLRDPVGVTEVARAVNDCDLEVIFFPPRFANNTYALPNKFFESVQGRLGIVVGRSPEIVPLVEQYGLGVVVDGWTAHDLAAAINALTAEQITAMKQAADRAAEELSTRGEGPRFLAVVGAGPEA